MDEIANSISNSNTDAFQASQDKYIEGLAEEIMRTKTVSPENMAQLMSWNTMTTLTIKRLWMNKNAIIELVDAKLAEHKKQCDAEDGEEDGVNSKKRALALRVFDKLFSERGLLFIIIVMLLIYMAAKDGVHYGDEIGKFPKTQSVETATGK